MKKGILITILLSIILAATLAGCGESSSSKGLNNNPWLMVEVQLSDTNTFTAWGFLKDSNHNTLNANITVNGTPVFSDHTIEITGLKKEGDSVTIIASHSTIGTIQKTFTIPQTVKNVSTNQILANWLSRQDPTLTLTWVYGDSDYYMIGVNGQITSGTNYPWRQSPATIDASESDSFLYNKPSSLSIIVQGVKYIDLTNQGFFSGSQFSVEGFKSDPLTYQ